MRISHQLPNNTKECIRLLEYLGFVRKKRIGKGGHQYKYIHPKRRNICPNERPFIIIPSRFYKQLSEHIYKKLLCFEFSKKEIRDACKKL